MSDNKKYYYLKLKENFYDSEEIIILQNMPDGYLYSDILMKLYLRSLKAEGKLLFKDRIPYNATVLAQVVRHSVGVVEKALGIFEQLGLIEVLDNGAIYMLDIQNYIGQSSSEADRKRSYRKMIDEEKDRLLPSGQMSQQMSRQISDKNPPETETETELKKDLETTQDKKSVSSENCYDSDLIYNYSMQYCKIKGEMFSPNFMLFFQEQLNEGIEADFIWDAVITALGNQSVSRPLDYAKRIVLNRKQEGIRTLEQLKNKNTQFGKSKQDLEMETWV